MKQKDKRDISNSQIIICVHKSFYCFFLCCCCCYIFDRHYIWFKCFFLVENFQSLFELVETNLTLIW